MSGKLTIKVIVFVAIFALAILLLNTESMAASFSASAAKTTLDVGKTTTLTITVADCEGRFSFSSSDTSVVGISDTNEWIGDKSNSYSITLTAKKAGKATIKITADDVSDKSFNSVTGSKSVTITVVEPKEETPNNNSGNTSSKSSDATLKTITVGGKTYSNPKTDITVSSVSSSTSSIKIDATTNNSKAKVSGTGTKDLVTGTNKFTLKVTAENGATKSYVIRIARLAEESTTPNIVDEKVPEETKVEEPIIEELKLTSLAIEGVELIPVFSSEIFEYSAYITDLEEVNITATANLEGTNIEIIGNKGLIEGENIIIIKATKDDKVLEYKIIVNKAGISLIQETIEEEKEEEKETKGIIRMV